MSISFVEINTCLDCPEKFLHFFNFGEKVNNCINSRLRRLYTASHRPTLPYAFVRKIEKIWTRKEIKHFLLAPPAPLKYDAHCPRLPQFVDMLM